MLVVTRFRVPPDAGADEVAAFRDGLEQARGALAACRGHQRSRVGRNVDDPGLWVLVTEWDGVGAYRRALSTYDVKLRAVPLLGQALDEPSAYEDAGPGTDLNVAGARSLG